MYHGWQLHYPQEYYDCDTESEYYEEEIYEDDPTDYHPEQQRDQSTAEDDENFYSESENDYQESEPPPLRYTQSAPELFNYESNDPTTSPSQNARSTHRSLKLLDYIAGECESDGLEDLLDSDVFETTVLHKNETASTALDEEYYSSESDADTRRFIRSKRNNKCPLKNAGSGISLTTHHKYGMKEEELDPNLQGFGQAKTMRSILTVKEQLMLGIIPNLKSLPQEKVLPTKNICSTSSACENADKLKTAYFLKLDEIPSTRQNSPNLNKRLKHKVVLSIDRLKLMPCDDPAAAGDTVNNQWTQKPPEEKVFISATQSFRRSIHKILLNLPEQADFVLDKKESWNSQQQLQCLNWSREHESCTKYSKPVLTVLKQEKSSGDILPRIPSIRLQTCSSERILGSENLSYNCPKEKPNFERCRSNQFNRRKYSPHYSWRAKPKNEDIKLDAEFRKSCSKLWSHKLPNSFQNSGPAFNRPCSEKWGDQLKIIANKKIEFTYTSHESFFKSPNTLKMGFDRSPIILPKYSSVDSVDSHETKYCNFSDCQHDYHPMKFVQRSQSCSSSDSSTSKDTFTVLFHPLANKPALDESSYTTETDCDSEDPQAKTETGKFNSSSYTILTTLSPTIKPQSKESSSTFETDYESDHFCDKEEERKINSASYTILPTLFSTIKPQSKESSSTLETDYDSEPSCETEQTVKVNSPSYTILMHSPTIRSKSQESSSTHETDYHYKHPCNQHETKVNSPSYTILKSRIDQRNGNQVLSGRRISSLPPRPSSSTLSSADSLSNSSKTTFPYDSPTTSSSTTDSSDECFLNEHNMTDKMRFKFVLDENGSEVDISVSLPFPVPRSDLPVDSPLIAAAILGRAQELVLQSMGFAPEINNPPLASYFLEEDKTKQSHIVELTTPLQCSVSLEELSEIMSHNHPTSPKENEEAVSQPQNCENINRNSSAVDVRDVEMPPQIHTKDSWLRIMKFIIRLLLCGCCRNTCVKALSKNPHHHAKRLCGSLFSGVKVSADEIMACIRKDNKVERK